MQNNTKIEPTDEEFLNDWIKSLKLPVESKEQLDEKAKFLQGLYALDETAATRSLDEAPIADKLNALAKYVQTHTYIHKDQEAVFLSSMDSMKVNRKKDAAVNSIDALEQLLYYAQKHEQNEDSMRDYVQSALASVDFTVCEEGVSEALQRAALNLLTQGELLSVLYALKVDFIEKEALKYLSRHPLTGLAGMQTHDVQSLKNAIADEYGLQKVENIHTTALSSLDAEYREKYINDWKTQLEASRQASFWPQAVQELFGWRLSAFQDIQIVDLAPGQILPPMEHVQSNTLFFQKDAAGNNRVLPYVHDASQKLTALDMQRDGIVMNDWHEENRWSEGITRHHILFKAKLYEYLAENGIQVMASSTASQAYHDHYQQLLGLDDSEMSMCAEMLTVSKSMPWTGYFTYNHFENARLTENDQKDIHVSKMAILSYAIAKAIFEQAKASGESMLDFRISNCLDAWEGLKKTVSWSAYNKTPEQIKAHAADVELLKTVEAYGLQQWYVAQCFDWGLSLSDMLGVAVQMREHAWSVDDKPKMLKWSEGLIKNAIGAMMGEDLETHMQDLIKVYGEDHLYRLAVEQSTNALLEVLVEKKMNPNRVDDGFGTPLVYATSRRAYEKIQILLTHPDIDVNAVVDDGEEEWTALSVAVREGDERIVGLLLERSDIDIDNRYKGMGALSKNNRKNRKYTVLMMALEDMKQSHDRDNDREKLACREIATLLIDCGAMTYYDDMPLNPLCVAIEVHDAKLALMILGKQQYSRGALQKAFIEAVAAAEEKGMFEVLEALLAIDIDPKLDILKEYRTFLCPLAIALRTGHTQTVDALLAYANIDAGAANTMRDPILNDALKYGRLDVALHLLKQGVDPAWKGSGELSALDVAKTIYQESIETKEDLLQYLTTTLKQQRADSQIDAHGLFTRLSGSDLGENPAP